MMRIMTILPTRDSGLGQSGFGLIELLIIIVVVGIMLSVAMQSVTVAVEDARLIKTEREMTALEHAIVGEPSITNDGIRSDFGYVGDIGAFPSDLSALYSNPGGYATWDGPYLKSNFTQDSTGPVTDEWGQTYNYSGGITLTSTGSGQTITRKIASATSDYLFNSMRGVIRDVNDSVPRMNFMDSVNIEMIVPDGFGSATTKTVNPDAAGYFAFDSLSVGRHPLRIIYTPQADTLKRKLTILPRHKSNPVPQYYFASAWFSSAASGCSSDSLQPSGVGSTTSLVSAGCGSNWQCVDETTADDDVTYVGSSGTGWLTDTYAAGSPVDTTCTINSVTVWIRARRFVKAANAKVVLHTGGVDYEGTEVSLSDVYTDVNSQWSVNPATGSSWTWPEIEAMQIGVSLQATKATHPARCTRVWVVLELSS